MGISLVSYGTKVGVAGYYYFLEIFNIKKEIREKRSLYGKISSEIVTSIK